MAQNKEEAVVMRRLFPLNCCQFFEACYNTPPGPAENQAGAAASAEK